MGEKRRLPFGWVMRQGGDIWESDGPTARMIAYKTMRGWVLPEPMPLEALQAIVDILESGG